MTLATIEIVITAIVLLLVFGFSKLTGMTTFEVASVAALVFSTKVLVNMYFVKKVLVYSGATNAAIDVVKKLEEENGRDQE